ncbi:MAG: aminoacyl-tRNA hydrolase [Pseudomonadota bacterium]|uniref:aminoacyl-tRNA hydrolase n=1 Tax=unclassified Phenylobacterium TaxID=2640670 RepID=UPI000A6AA343|nr:MULTISPECIES: aminoacyl-tRNA hydrolase [unclassified Phenylobacterium]MBT9472542.1 aminoacyl-tRNA hydrolase [Phenylobacterium sp.]
MKQVIVVNQALNLPPGKLAAQVAHAAVGGLLRAPREQQIGWLDVGMPKVVLRCESEAALFDLVAQAEAAGLPVMLVRDAGRTVVEAGTPTCVGIGPGEISKVDAITGTLKLVR